MREGYVTYDFMAGENRLKASFASHWRDMVWLSVQRRVSSFLAGTTTRRREGSVAGAGELRRRPPESGDGTPRRLRAAREFRDRHSD